jgi:hypothetical protein
VLNFLVDTGSDITSITTKDCGALGISFSRLGSPLRKVKGLVKSARRWAIKPLLRFMTDDSKIATFGPFYMFIMETDPDCPNILGRDFFIEFNLRLFFDPIKKELYLEK